MKVTSLQFILITLIAALATGGSVYIGTRPRQVTSTDSHHPRGAEPPSTLDPGQTSANAGATPIGANGTGLQPTPDPAKRPNVFGLNGAVYLEDIPAGRFHDALSRLNEPARRYALDKLGRLRVPLSDVASLNVDKDGQLFYQCITPRLPPVPVITLASVHDESQGRLPGVTPDISVEEASVPIASPPIRHSRPGTTKVIYLDFNGHTITGTAWNNSKGSVGDANYRPAVASYAAKAFDTDGDPTTFSDTEQALIVQVWERVAEDYRGFDVDVTTESPASFTATTGRILITNSVDANGVNMPSSTAGGVAYLDVFGTGNYASYYSPALVYADRHNNYASYIAETASHEMGHNLSLSHDGTTTGDEYYNGQGGGETSWNTIMGGAYSENVTQWSKGEYYNANNQEDDLAIIAGHLGYGADDHSDSNATATPLTVSGLTVSGSGVISQTGEGDRFAFASGPGAIAITVSPFRSASQSYGGNLDVALELYDSTGNVVASTNPSDVTGATLNATVSGGTFYLKVYGAGNGTPLFGYSDYASLGWYTISGTVVATTPVAPGITNQPANQSVYAGQSAQFTVVGGGYPGVTFQWQRMPAGSGTWFNLSNSSTYSGTATATLNIAAASLAMNGDQFRCVLTNSEGSITSSPAALAVLNINPSLGVILLCTSSGSVSSTLFIRSDGSLWGLGANNSGQLGDGTNINRYSPVSIATEVIAAAGGAQHNLFIKSDGSLWGMGDNSAGQLGDGTTIYPSFPRQIATGVVSVTTNWQHTLFIKSDGTLWGMGSNQSGKLGNMGGDSRSPILIATDVTGASAGEAHSLFIKADGSLWGMGSNSYGQLGDVTTNEGHYNPIQIATGVAAVSTGNYYSLFIKLDGTLWGMGFNGTGQLGDGTTTDRKIPVQIATNVVASSGNWTHSLYIKSDGSLWGTGRNDSGQLGDVARIDHKNPVQIVTGVAQMAAGYSHSLFLKSTGSLWGMGYNGFGQLGDWSAQVNEGPRTLLASGPLIVPSVPTGVMANNSALPNVVRITWASTIAATSYEVWRNTTNNAVSATRIAGNVPIALYYDLTAMPQTAYYYWIKAVNPAGTSGFSSAAIVAPSNAVISISVQSP